MIYKLQVNSMTSKKSSKKNHREWSVNEVYQGKPWNYFAVETHSTVDNATRLIEFPDSEYIVVSGSGPKDELFDQLTYQAFGEVLSQIKDYAYIGGQMPPIVRKIQTGPIMENSGCLLSKNKKAS